MDLDHVTFAEPADGNIAFCSAGGRLVANLTDMDVAGNADREKTSYLEISLRHTRWSGAANVTALSLDSGSAWTVTGDSRIAVLSAEDGAVISAETPVTVTYQTLAEGTRLPQTQNVSFVQSDSVRDDYAAKKMGPPPGGPGMPPPAG